MLEPEIPTPEEELEVLEETEQPKLSVWRRLHRPRHYAIAVAIVGLGLLSLWWFRKPVAEVVKKVDIKTPVSQPVGGRIRKITPAGNWSKLEVNAKSRFIYHTGTLQPAKYAVEQFDITYTSTDPRTGKEIEVNGRAYLPVGAGKNPLIAFGPGTTGPGPQCAPTLERSSGKNWGGYDYVLSFYAGQGYPVALTDYANRGEGAISPYFVGESEARVMLDLAKAMQKFQAEPNFRGVPVGKNVFFAGYSQGGHAALWAEKLRSKYAPEVKNAGMILFAPATDMHKTFTDSAKGATTVWLPPYVYAAYKDYYGLTTPASDVFTARYASTVETDARKYCINNVEPFRTSGIMYFGTGATIGSLYTPAFLQAMKTNTISQVTPEFGKLLDDNLAGEPVDPPVLVISGRTDQVILVSAQDELVRRICRGGTSNLRWELSGANHYSSMFDAGRYPVLSWLNQVSLGHPPESQCPQYES